MIYKKMIYINFITFVNFFKGLRIKLYLFQEFYFIFFLHLGAI
jgi:hypothetical protein